MKTTTFDLVKKIRESLTKYEQPTVDLLNKLGFPAILNEGTAKQNREIGDVVFGPLNAPSPLGGLSYTLEIQVSEKYPQFSYTASKIDKYKGFGKPERRYVMLGAKDGAGMIFMVVKADDLHPWIRANLKPVDDKYYVINPARLSTFSTLYMGQTLEEAILHLATALMKEPGYGEGLQR